MIWVGDFNWQIGDIVEGNRNKVSHGGSLIRDLIESDKYVLLNASPKVKNGPWTRYDPSSPDDDDKNVKYFSNVEVHTPIETDIALRNIENKNTY